VIAWVVTLRLLIAALVACPLTRVTGEPEGEPSTVNWTVPLAVDGVTVAVKVMPSPKTDGLAEDATAVLELAAFTVWVRVEDVLPVKFPSPL
jgi:hypothetical protein